MVPGEHGLNPAHRNAPQTTIPLPLGCRPGQTRELEDISGQAGLWLSVPVPPRGSRGAPGGCGAGRALGTAPACRELAGAIRVYISMIFSLPLQLIMRQDQEEPGDAGGPGSLSETAPSLNKNPSVASKLSLPFMP